MPSMLIIPAVLLTQTRAGILALIAAGVYGIYQLGQITQYRKYIICTIVVALLFVGAVSSTRHIEALNQFNFDSKKVAIKQLTSDREELWYLSKRGISKRPLLGWGFNGFGAAYPEVKYRKSIAKVIRLDDFDFDYEDKHGQIQTAQLPTTKTHNLFLDTILSVGLLGMTAYLALFGWCLWQVFKSPYRGIEAVFIAYLAFTFTWFECAQFSHLAWWALSFFGMDSVRDQGEQRQTKGRETVSSVPSPPLG